MSNRAVHVYRYLCLRCARDFFLLNTFDGGAWCCGEILSPVMPLTVVPRDE